MEATVTRESSEVSFFSEHFKFHKVVYRHYSGEVKNVYMILQQIYSRNHIPNFIKIAEFYRRYYKNILVSFFPDTLYETIHR